MAVFSHIGSKSESRATNHRRRTAIPHHWAHGARFEPLANLAHELRTPIQVLLGYLDILRDDLNNEVGARARHVLERINVNAYDLAQTVENVLDFTFAASRAESHEEEDVELSDLLAEITPAIQAASQGKHLAVDFDLSRAPARVRTCRRALRAIVVNLASNAVKFTDSGSVRIAISAAWGGRGVNQLELCVDDTGPGIDHSRLKAAFAPYSQLSRTSIRRYRGMGLGLAVVKRNLEALGAALEVNSESGMGSTFTVRIPIRPQSDTPEQTSRAVAKSRGKAVQWRSSHAAPTGNGASGRPRLHAPSTRRDLP